MEMCVNLTRNLIYCIWGLVLNLHSRYICGGHLKYIQVGKPWGITVEQGFISALEKKKIGFKYLGVVLNI